MVKGGSSSSDGGKAVKKTRDLKGRYPENKEPTPSNDGNRPSSFSCATDETKNQLFQMLDTSISRDGLVDLHTHLMGMGNADFWVTKIMEGYLLRLRLDIKRKLPDVKYKFSDICEASHLTLGNLEPSPEWLQSMVESRLFDGSPYTLLDIPNFDPANPSIPNELLVNMMHAEDEHYTQRDGPLRSLVRNWFEFLDTNGNHPDQNAILETYRGKFTPKFNACFKMRDVIIEQAPDVLSILTNHVLGKYAYAGANYVEFSVSTKDIMNDGKRKLMTENVFSGEYFRRIGSGASRRNSAVGDMSETAAASNADMIEPGFGMDEEGNMATNIDSDTFERGSTVLNPPEILNPQVKASVVAKRTTTESRRVSSSMPGDLTIPPVQTGTSFKPRWRKYYRDYQEKNTRQMWKFLAAFPRTRGVRLPRWDPTDELLVYKPRESTESPIDILASLATDKTRLSQMFGDKKSHEQLLDDLAAHLCEDEALIQIFPKGGNRCFDLMKNFKDNYQQIFGERIAASDQLCVVGVDCVGDEFGHPYCMFAHSEFIGLINECREINPHFGVRIHAGEGLMRHSTFDEYNYALGNTLSAPHATFMLHVLILIKSITKVINGISRDERSGNRVSVRIGHGIAFLYQPKNDGPFKTALDNFRDLLREHDIVCELNPTSNHMLLQHSFTDGSDGKKGVKNIRTLRSFFELKLPVILCTDDDGIWDIRRCAKHGTHVSVARELCDAIANGDIQTEDELAQVTKRTYAFIAPEVVGSKKESQDD